MLKRLLFLCVAIYLLASAAWVINAGVVREGSQVQLLNVSYDPTRELWRELNTKFLAKREQSNGKQVQIRQSHGGSSSQARSVIDGLDADVVTLAMFPDTDAIRKAGLIQNPWVDKLPNHSLPYVSTIVFVVRKGNPKGIKDWPDLARDGIEMVTPSPKTSGNGKWSFLALWGAITEGGGTEEDATDYVRKVYAKWPVQDSSARAATMTFALRSQGDVHLTWENEAYLEVAEANGNLEIVYPSISVMAEPHVAIVDKVVDRKGTRALAQEYMEFLYTEEAQEIIAHHNYRPTNPAVAARMAEKLPPIKLFRVSNIAKDWDEIQKRFFAEGAIFDQVTGGGKR